MESGSTREDLNEGENGSIILTAHRHNLTLRLISELPLPSMPDETGLETPEQTHLDNSLVNKILVSHADS